MKPSLHFGKSTDVHHYRPAALLTTFACCVSLSLAVGIVGNCFGFLIYRNYYPMVLRWVPPDGTDFAAVIGQGAFESLVAGSVLGIIYVFFVGLVTRSECPATLACFHLLKWALLLAPGWAFGGIMAVILYQLSPYQIIHIASSGVPEVISLSSGDQIRFLWIAGTIDSTYLTGLLVIVLASVTLRPRWRKFRIQQRLARSGWTPYCPQCGYSQRGSRGRRCPECGSNQDGSSDKLLVSDESSSL